MSVADDMSDAQSKFTTQNQSQNKADIKIDPT